jgi:hypothetical protein
MSPPSSWSKSRLSRKQNMKQAAGRALLVSCLDCSFTLKVEAIFSPKRQLISMELHGSTSQKSEIFIR